MQVLNAVSTDISLQLMKAGLHACQTFVDLSCAIQGAPAYMQALALRAWMPCIDAQGLLHAAVPPHRSAKSVRSVLRVALPEMPQLDRVCLEFEAQCAYTLDPCEDNDHGQILRAVSSLPNLTVGSHSPWG